MENILLFLIAITQVLIAYNLLFIHGKEHTPIRITSKSLLILERTWIKTAKNALFLDTILIVIAGVDHNSLDLIHLNLLKCGYFITLPDLKIALKFLDKRGLIVFKDDHGQYNIAKIQLN